MGLFDGFKNSKTPAAAPVSLVETGAGSVAAGTTLAERVLNSIAEGVITVDGQGKVQLMNPAAGAITGYGMSGLGLNVTTVLRFDDMTGRQIPVEQNVIFQALTTGQPTSTRDYILTTAQGKAVPVEVKVAVGQDAVRVITFRDITVEKQEEGAQMEFISTASHEMRTPVASIEGYLGLALNPQTATIDERARKYLDEAHKASQHLGRLFQNLLDVTKLDDQRLKAKLTPVEILPLVRSIVEGQGPAMQQKGLQFSFGTGGQNGNSNEKLIMQALYALVDVDFLREVMNNLVENAIKYTPTGGSIWVGVRGDSDQILINVTDTGIGISPDDLAHVFQKFYRADNSQTREIGGTGLGLYLVKERVEAMGGKVWAESTFAAGSTFYVSLPRLTSAEYERRRQIIANNQAMGAAALSVGV